MNDEVRKGTEPDDCYYLQNASRVIGKDVDLNVDPPPDLAIEVDIASPSLKKFPIYAALGVTELWRYKRGRVRFYQLDIDDYEEIAQSLAFPFLTPDIITEHVRMGLERGPMPMLRSFVDWLEANQPTA
jgi:Uma2 family endonuclease